MDPIKSKSTASIQFSGTASSAESSPNAAATGTTKSVKRKDDRFGQLPKRVSKGSEHSPVRGDLAAQRSTATAKLATGVAAQKIYPLTTTLKSPDELEALLAKFAEDQKAGKPAVLVVGASVNGSMTAAKAARLGANVLVMEKRDGFSRDNIFALKEETLYTMASVSPDGTLLKQMHDANMLNFRQSRIEAGKEDLQQKPTPDHRFADWLLPGTPGEGLPPMIPVRKSKPADTPAFVDKPLSGNHQPNTLERLPHLDLAEHDVINAMRPEEWRYTDLTKLSNSSLGISQTRYFETGLNRYLAAQEGVDIAQGEVDVENRGDHFGPTLKMGGKSIVPDFEFDLVHLAEGSRGKNALAHAERLTTDFGETWFQRNFNVEPDLKPGSSLVPNRGDPENPAVIPIRFNRTEDTVVNVAHLAARTDQTEDVWRRNHDLTQAVLRASGSQASADDPTIVSYDSGPIAVAWGRAVEPAKMNLALGGDAAANKSPSAGAGASLAASAYPEMTQRLMEHPGFKDPTRRNEANAAYNEQARQVSNVWEDKSIRLMRALGALPDGALSDIRANSGRNESLLQELNIKLPDAEEG